MSSAHSDEQVASNRESERAALAGLNARDPLRRRAVSRLQAAWNELRTALFVLGIESVDQWIADRVELELLFKAMAWDHWCPHHVLRTSCPPSSRQSDDRRMVEQPPPNGDDSDAHQPSR